MLRELKETLATAGDRFRLGQSGKLTAVSVILLSASMAPSFAGPYPVTTAAAQSPSQDRPCTELEIAADLLPSECGTLTLAAVVARYYAVQDEGDDG
jgi:hypothetical protein